MRPKQLKTPRIADWLSQMGIDQAQKFSASRRAFGYSFLVVLVLCSLLSLILLNVAVRRLWSELLYAIIVMAVALWALGQTRFAREILEYFGVKAFSIKRAFLWSAFVLVAIPVAVVQWPYGPVILAIGPVAAALLYWRRGQGGPAWLAAAGGFVLVLVVGATIGPQIGAARPSEEPPLAAPESPEDLALAERVRPILFFDDVERRFPVDIEKAVERRHLRACREAVLHDPCPEVTDARKLDLGADYLKFEDFAMARGGDDGSAYYYRVSNGPAVSADRGARMYVDFWWFFTRNPTPLREGAMCAPGFRLPGKTCHDHEADWEGVTVVLGSCSQGGASCRLSHGGRTWAPIAVRYAQHEFLVTYAWEPTLQRLWSDIRRDPLRPLVFVARDSHASYAARCRRSCKQLHLGLVRREGTHDGKTPWVWNAECVTCLKPLPIGSNGKPAAWSAFEGRWGDQHCVLGGAYCDETGAPRAPPKQDRYHEPWLPGRWVCLDDPVEPDSKVLTQCARSHSPEGEPPDRTRAS